MEIEDELLDLYVEWEEKSATDPNVDIDAMCGNRPEIATRLRKIIDQAAHVDSFVRRSTLILEESDPAAKDETQSLDPGEKFTTDTSFMKPRRAKRGGLGVVFEAEDVALNRKVALKVMRRDLCSHRELRRTFQLEAEITARLDHPGVVPVHVLGRRDNGSPFLVMRYVEGTNMQEEIQSLHRKNKRDRAFYASRRFRILLERFATVARTVAYAHQRGIVHLDIKPANILLGRYGETTVADWGIARPTQRSEEDRKVDLETIHILQSLAGQGSSRSGGSFGPGTIVYMSPEQARNDPELGVSCDVYCLGSTLYEILTGTTSIDAKNLKLMEARDQILSGRIKPPRQRQAAVPKALEAICQKAMMLSARQRYPRASDIAEDIERYLADEPVHARKDSWLEGLLRSGRRNTMAILLTTLFFVLLSLGATGMTQLLRSQKNEAQRQTVLAKENEAAATRASRQSLRVAARMTAAMVALDTHDRYRVLETVARDPAIQQALAQSESIETDGLTPEEIREKLPRAIKAILERIHDRYAGTIQLDSWFLCNSQGICIARVWPSNREEQWSSVGGNYAHRDYFHGNGIELAEGKKGMPFHVSVPHRSAVYISSVTGRPKIAFSVPIYDVGGTEFLGVLGMSLRAGYFEFLERELEFADANHEVVLIELRDKGTSETNTRLGVIIEHPELADHLASAEEESEVTLLPAITDEAALQRFGMIHDMRRRQLGRDPNGESLDTLIEGFVDPLRDGTPLVAAFEPVLLNGRPRKDEADTEIGILVIEKPPPLPDAQAAE